MKTRRMNKKVQTMQSSRLPGERERAEFYKSFCDEYNASPALLSWIVNNPPIPFPHKVAIEIPAQCMPLFSCPPINLIPDSRNAPLVHPCSLPPRSYLPGPIVTPVDLKWLCFCERGRGALKCLGNRDRWQIEANLCLPPPHNGQCCFSLGFSPLCGIGEL